MLEIAFTPLYRLSALPTSSPKVVDPAWQQFFHPDWTPDLLQVIFLPVKMYMVPRQFPEASVAPLFWSIAVLTVVVCAVEGSMHVAVEHSKLPAFLRQG
jgi:hypothetical protein